MSTPLFVYLPSIYVNLLLYYIILYNATCDHIELQINPQLGMMKSRILISSVSQVSSAQFALATWTIVYQRVEFLRMLLLTFKCVRLEVANENATLNHMFNVVGCIHPSLIDSSFH